MLKFLHFLQNIFILEQDIPNIGLFSFTTIFLVFLLLHFGHLYLAKKLTKINIVIVINVKVFIFLNSIFISEKIISFL